MQIMFICFGLLPDIIIMAVSLALGFAGAAVVISATFHIGLVLLFLGISPLSLVGDEKEIFK